MTRNICLSGMKPPIDRQKRHPKSNEPMKHLSLLKKPEIRTRMNIKLP